MISTLRSATNCQIVAEKFTVGFLVEHRDSSEFGAPQGSHRGGPTHITGESSQRVFRSIHATEDTIASREKYEASSTDKVCSCLML